MIRCMDQYDLRYIVLCLQDMRKEIPSCAESEDDFEYVLSNLKAMQEHEQFIGLIEDGGKGFMFGCMSSTWYDKRIKAYEQLLYVTPAHRKSSLGSRLISAFCNEAKNRGAVEVLAGESLGYRSDAVATLYKRKGFTSNGESFKLKIE